MTFADGIAAWWRDEPDPGPGEREGRKGWRHAAVAAQDGPLGLFNVYVRTYPYAKACVHVFVGQVVAENQRDAATAALACWTLDRFYIAARRAGFDQFDVGRNHG